MIAKLYLCLGILVLLPGSAHAACRTYTQTVMAGRDTAETHGITCQDGNGVWHVQTRLDERDMPVEDFAFEEPMTFGAVTNYPNPMFKFVRILPVPGIVDKAPLEAEPH